VQIVVQDRGFEWFTCAVTRVPRFSVGRSQARQHVFDCAGRDFGGVTRVPPIFVSFT
jgi:hypothetical protein